MPSINNPATLRVLAAVAAVGLGAAMVGSLWVRPLDETGLWLLLQGGAYLFIALGLFGQSRFTLYVGIAAPVVFFALRPEHAASQLPLADLLALIGDCTLATLCATVLWRSQNGTIVAAANQREQQQQE